MVFQQELLVGFITVLGQSNPDFVRANVKAFDRAAEEILSVGKVLAANAGGTVNQEDNVSLSGCGTFWSRGEKTKLDKERVYLLFDSWST